MCFKIHYSSIIFVVDSGKLNLTSSNFMYNVVDYSLKLHLPDTYILF